MNPLMVHYLNTFLGLGVMALLALSLSTLILFFTWPKNRRNAYFDFIHRHFLLIAFLISLFSSIFPLVYSEIVGFLPCVLCWWQRVFMFPTMFIFAVALWRKDRMAIRYATPLLLAGFSVSMYQNARFLLGNNLDLPCDASGVSCYQILIPEFGGMIQIPLMALSAFLSLLTLVLVTHFYGKDN